MSADRRRGRPARLRLEGSELGVLAMLVMGGDEGSTGRTGVTTGAEGRAGLEAMEEAEVAEGTGETEGKSGWAEGAGRKGGSSLCDTSTKVVGVACTGGSPVLPSLPTIGTALAALGTALTTLTGPTTLPGLTGLTTLPGLTGLTTPPGLTGLTASTGVTTMPALCDASLSLLEPSSLASEPAPSSPKCSLIRLFALWPSMRGVTPALSFRSGSKPRSMSSFTRSTPHHTPAPAPLRPAFTAMCSAEQPWSSTMWYAFSFENTEKKAFRLSWS